jgi:hypothetical protein
MHRYELFLLPTYLPTYLPTNNMSVSCYKVGSKKNKNATKLTTMVSQGTGFYIGKSCIYYLPTNNMLVSCYKAGSKKHNRANPPWLPRKLEPNRKQILDHLSSFLHGARALGEPAPTVVKCTNRGCRFTLADI